jgi:FkbM family methyltransferase
MLTKKINFNEYQLSLQIRDEADESVVAEIFKLHEYRRAEEAIRQAKTAIVDLGAHAGFFSLYCRTLNQDAVIFAIEPDVGNLKQLAWHCQKNKLSKITIVPTAIAKESGLRQLEITPDTLNYHLLPKLNTEKKMVSNSLSVKCESWTEFCKKNNLTEIDLLKIDIEGGEKEIFSTLNSGDLSSVKQIILEYHNEKNDDVAGLVEQKLRDFGFSVERFPSRFDKRLGFLFARNKRQAKLRSL